MDKKPLQAPARTCAQVSSYIKEDFTALCQDRGLTYIRNARADPPSKWWTPLISFFGSRKVFDGYSASTIHG